MAAGKKKAAPAAAPEPDGHPMLIQLNEQLEFSGAAFRVATAEYLTVDAGEHAGTTIFADDRAKQLTSHFVPGDSDRAWGFGTGITWLIDGTEGTTASGLLQADTDAATYRAMETWQDQNCSTLPLIDLGGGASVPIDLGFVQFLLGFGGSPLIHADLTHAGVLPKAFFDALAPGGGSFILGVTFTATFGTDVDGNGKLDTAFREIYYNDEFGWNDGANIDFETVALHEAGHGLSQGHFGKIFATNKNGKLHFAPHAVMNASYSGVQTSLLGTDNGGHCSIWGSWPNN